MGRASMPSSVCSCRNVNCVGRNVKPAGFSGSIASVLGVSGREDTIRVRKPRGGPAKYSTSDVPRGRNATAVFRDSDTEEGVTLPRTEPLFPLGHRAPLEFFAGPARCGFLNPRRIQHLVLTQVRPGLGRLINPSLPLQLSIPEPLPQRWRRSPRTHVRSFPILGRNPSVAALHG